MYKGFALAVLLIAPVLVMLADTITPKPKPAEQPSASAPVQEEEAPPVPAVAQIPYSAPQIDPGTAAAETGQRTIDLSSQTPASAVIAATSQPVAPSVTYEPPPADPTGKLTREWQSRMR